MAVASVKLRAFISGVVYFEARSRVITAFSLEFLAMPVVNASDSKLPFAVSVSGERVAVSVLVVNFNSGEWLSRCVASVLASDIRLEILVGDNGSADNSLASLAAAFGNEPSLRVFAFGQNLGFAKAVNRLLAKAQGVHLLLLNPDCLIQPDTVRRMLHELMMRPECGMAGCLIRNMDGSEQRGCRREIPTLRSSLLRSVPRALRTSRFVRGLYSGGSQVRSFDLVDTPLPDDAAYIEAISGAFMLISREALQRVGSMDESYFLHCEDLDWCLRFSQAGYKILFVPSVEIVHKQGACSKTRPLRVEFHKHVGMLFFYRKFYGAKDGVFRLILMRCAIVLRFMVVSVSTLLRLFRR